EAGRALRVPGDVVVAAGAGVPVHPRAATTAPREQTADQATDPTRHGPTVADGHPSVTAAAAAARPSPELQVTENAAGPARGQRMHRAREWARHAERVGEVVEQGSRERDAGRLIREDTRPVQLAQRRAATLRLLVLARLGEEAEVAFRVLGAVGR